MGVASETPKTPSLNVDDTSRLFIRGRAIVEKYGLPLRASAGKAPDDKPIEAAATQLGRPVFFIDEDGYECEIIAAVTNVTGDIAYVESRAKDVGFNRYGAHQRQIDISIRVHHRDRSGVDRAAEIESYNPFFGCDVRLFEWVGESAVLIYREKHWTYACRFGDVWPPRFVKIEDRWIVNNGILAFIGYKKAMVGRLTFPMLDDLDPIPVAQAAEVGLLPANAIGK